MQGKHVHQPKLFFSVTLDSLVPTDNFYRRILATLDFRFLYAKTKTYYGREGNPSLDPVVFFKLLLVGYLNNITTDRRLITFASNSLDVRLFLGYELDQTLPWHSTISRTRALLGEEVFISLFQAVLHQCIQQGMVSGKRQAVDSAFVKANASMDSLQEKSILQDAVVWTKELQNDSQPSPEQLDKPLLTNVLKMDNTKVEDDKNSAKSTANCTKKSVGTMAKKKPIEAASSTKQQPNQDEANTRTEPKKWVLFSGVDTATNDTTQSKEPIPTPPTDSCHSKSNENYFSPTDPDARISYKPGKQRQLNYYAQVSVDTAHHVICGAGADFADQRDSQCLQPIVEQTRTNLARLGLTVEQLLADSNYASGESLSYIEEKQLDAWIPISPAHYRPQRDGFVYNQDKDYYECVQKGGNKAMLTFKRQADKKRVNGVDDKRLVYRSSPKDCRNCPLRLQCCGAKNVSKKIEDSIDKKYYRAMHQKLTQNPIQASKMSRIRSKTVEPVLGTLLTFMGMKRVSARGINNAHKHVLMASMSYNLKKLLKWMSKPRLKLANMLKIDSKSVFLMKHDLFVEPIFVF